MKKLFPNFFLGWGFTTVIDSKRHRMAMTRIGSQSVLDVRVKFVQALRYTFVSS